MVPDLGAKLKLSGCGRVALELWLGSDASEILSSGSSA